MVLRKERRRKTENLGYIFGYAFAALCHSLLATGYSTINVAIGRREPCV
jgi:hypothetical protein